MKTAAAALAVAAAAMTAATASAGERVSGARHISSGPFRVGATARPASRVSSSSPSGGPAAAPSSGPHAALARPRAFIGGRSAGFASPAAFASSRGSGPARFSVSHWMFARGGLRRVDGGSGGGSGSSGSGDPGSGSSGSSGDSTQQLPYGAFGTIPGALIRTEGLGFLYAPGDSGRFHAVEAGDRIAYQENLGHPLGGTGAFIGPPDTLPSATPHGNASGVTAITPNDAPNNTTVTIDNSSTDNSPSGGGIHDYGHGHGNGNGDH